MTLQEAAAATTAVAAAGGKTSEDPALLVSGRLATMFALTDTIVAAAGEAAMLPADDAGAEGVGTFGTGVAHSTPSVVGFRVVVQFVSDVGGGDEAVVVQTTGASFCAG